MVVTVTDASGPVGVGLEVEILFDHPDVGSCSEYVIGWSFGVCHDSPLLTVEEIVDGSALELANGGNPAALSVHSILDGGWCALAIINFFGDEYLPPALGDQLYVATYGSDTPTSSEICLCDTLGNPACEIVFLPAFCSDLEYIPATICGQIEVTPPLELRRGDVDVNGAIQLADAVALLEWLFSVSPPGSCEDAGDVNDSGLLEPLLDPFFLLLFLFQNGAPPPAPFAECGLDPSADSLGCDVYPPCP